MRVILFVPSVHSNLNNSTCLIYFCTSGRWIVPVRIKQGNFIFRVQVIVYQLIDMFNKSIEVVFTTICNSFYNYTTVYGFFPFSQCLSVKFISVHEVCVPFICDLNMAFKQVSQMEYFLSQCNNAWQFLLEPCWKMSMYVTEGCLYTGAMKIEGVKFPKKK